MDYLNKLAKLNLTSYAFAIITGAIMGLAICKLL